MKMQDFRHILQNKNVGKYHCSKFLFGTGFCDGFKNQIPGNGDKKYRQKYHGGNAGKAQLFGLAETGYCQKKQKKCQMKQGRA